MKLSDLLTELADIPYHQRLKRMVEIGRGSLSQPELEELLAQMSQRGYYLRLLALQAAIAAQDGHRVYDFARSDRSKLLRRLAITRGAGFMSDERCSQLMSSLSAGERGVLTRELCRHGRQGVIDSIVRQSGGCGPTSEIIELLPFATPAVVEEFRDTLLEQGNTIDWQRLARFHPQTVLGWLWEHPRDPRSPHRLSLVLRRLAQCRDPQILQYWKKALKVGFLASDLPCQEMLAADPQAAAEWQLTLEPNTRLRWGPVAERISPTTLTKLVAKGHLSLEYYWWKRCSLPTREALWIDHRDQLKSDLVEDKPIVPLWLSHLSETLRVQEARGEMKLAFGFNGVEEIEYYCFLPFEEATGLLAEYLAHPDVAVRAQGLESLTKLGRYHADRLGDILTILVQRENEADPARCAFLGALSQLPPARWQGRHFKQLGDILRHLISAADASARSIRFAQTLALKILPHQPQWASVWILKLLRHWGSDVIGTWSDYWPQSPQQLREALHTLDQELGPLLQEWRAQERFSSVFGLVRAVGRLLSEFPQLAECLEAICYHPEPEPAAEALAVLRSLHPSRLITLVPTLLQMDQSWSSQAGVRNFVEKHRQDLLHLCWSDGPMLGKFASGMTSWLLPFQGPFYRWTPDHQGRYADQLARFVKSEASFPAKANCLTTLGKLPAVAPTCLLEHSALEFAETALRDHALRQLARLDAGQGVERLLSALEDARARIAIYALRQAILAMPVSSALQILQSVGSPKITVRKEVARLLGDLPMSAGLEAVLELSKSNSNRDVALAIYRALWPHLEDERAWAVLWEARLSEDAVVRQSLIDIPEGRCSLAARDQLRKLMLELLSDKDRKTSKLVLQRLQQRPLSDPDGELFAAALELLEREPQNFGNQAAALMLRLCQDRPAQWSKAVAVVHKRPQCLECAIVALNQAEWPSMRVFKKHTQTTLQFLQADPTLLHPWLKLASNCFPLKKLLQLLEKELCDAEPVFAESQWDISQTMGTLLGNVFYRTPRDIWLKAMTELSIHTQDKMRRVAFEMLLLYVRSSGWTATSRSLLAQFQKDEAVLIARVARSLVPPAEPAVRS